MSVKRVKHVKKDDDDPPKDTMDDPSKDLMDDPSKDLMDDPSMDLFHFCNKLLLHSQWKTLRTFICGSNVEIPFCRSIASIFDVEETKLDVDQMLYNASPYAFTRSQSVPSTYMGQIVTIDTENIHIGYVRLIKEPDNTELLLTDFRDWKYADTWHGPALLEDNKNNFLSDKYSLSDDVTDEAQWNRNTPRNQDKVFAVHCPYWPVEATEWIIRARPHSFPSKSVIKRVVGYGCDFVQVSHKFSINKNEWRFSFSIAEALVAQSRPVLQKIVYCTLWVLNKKMKTTYLCTYYFKTLILWACEQKSSQFWNDELLINSVRELLIYMMTCLKLKCCVNYFIPGNNMMDHLAHTDISHDIEELWCAVQSVQLILDILDVCRKLELGLTNTVRHYEFPAWLGRACVICYHLDNDHYFSYTELLRLDLKNDLRKELVAEFSDIFKGLRSHELATSCESVPRKSRDMLKSESYLCRATSLCESQERAWVMDCSLDFSESVYEQFMDCDADTPCTILNVNDKQSFDDTLKCRPVNITLHCVTDNNISEDMLQEFPGRSPTVNISWFIAKAYLANLYDTTKRDVSLTIQTCDDIIHVYRQSFMNKWFAERMFPVVLSTHWMSIYDKEIQDRLGFYSLCSYVLDKCSGRSVYLGVCPVQFALYVKLRAACREGCEEAKEHITIYNQHRSECECDDRVNNGLWLLASAVTSDTITYALSITL